MKKILITLSVVLLASCSSTADGEHAETYDRFTEIEEHETDNYIIRIIQDERTRCKSKITESKYDNDISETPLYKSDNTVDCD